MISDGRTQGLTKQQFAHWVVRALVPLTSPPDATPAPATSNRACGSLGRRDADSPQAFGFSRQGLFALVLTRHSKMI